ncbi:MAG: O-antigen ligase family protein [Pyrinomonadaceae bacterium]|nr:O-antigen ligase family protein [Pyrinomonadaceae bacterium]
MKDLKQGNPQAGLFEPAIVGTAPSRTSQAIFVLLCLIAALTVILFGGVDNGTWVVVTVLIGSVCLCWIADAWRGRAFLINRNAILLPLIGMVSVGMVQLLPLFSAEGPAGLPTTMTQVAISLDPYSTRLFLIRLVIFTIFFAAALTFINSEKRLRTTAGLITVFGALMAFFGIIQRLVNPEGIYGIRGTPQAIPFGSFVNQHHFAAFMVMCSGITLGALFGRDTNRERRLLLLVAAILMGMATLITSSRGGLIALVATLAFVIVSTVLAKDDETSGPGGAASRARARRMVAFGAVFFLVVVGSVLFLGESNSVIRGIGLSGQADVSSGRSHFWSIAVRIFVDHPIIGTGLDAFAVAFTRYDTWPGVFRVEQAHNDYLQMLADAGVLGFACVIAFIYLLFTKGLSVVRETRSPYRRTLAIGALAGCVGILVHSFFDFPLRTPSNAFIFLLLATIAIVDVKMRRTSEH